ncbi:MAG: BspA family leucine-rich repeat surface protein [Defluviitaleaceae bacterium]|nr:BspA family leucine-rich repeat surface protein [Defluviitaleaceae bacterium]
MRKFMVGVATNIILILVLISCSRNGVVIEHEIHGGAALRRDVTQLVNNATHIVRAEILDSRVEEIRISLIPDDSMEPRYRIHTIYQLRILEVFMGGVAIDDIIEGAQVGGQLGNVSLVYSRFVYFNNGDELVFFLICYRTLGFEHAPVQMEILTHQGIFRPAPSEAGLHEVLVGIGAFPDFQLPLTVDDLNRIQDGTFGIGTTPTPTPPPPINRDLLIAAITEAEAFDLDLFPDWDHAPFLNAWEVAITVRDNPLATQAQVDTAAIQLRTEMNNIGLIISGPYPIADGVVSDVFWTLFGNGNLFISPGHIQWWESAVDGIQLSPWHDYRQHIRRIIFTGPVTAGTSLQGLFSELSSVTTIEGLWNIDTRNVTDMGWMFYGAESLHHLDLSMWCTGNVTTMNNMFSGANALYELTLGSDFMFQMSVPAEVGLREGTWQNESGAYVFTAAELMTHHNANPVWDIWTMH